LCQLYESCVDLVYRYFYNQFEHCSKAEQLVYTRRFTRETFLCVVEKSGRQSNPWENRLLTLWLFDLMQSVLRRHSCGQGPSGCRIGGRLHPGLGSKRMCSGRRWQGYLCPSNRY
jgi:hypothetical protein